jgi:tetratricopeptide (TPR) repeat protein
LTDNSGQAIPTPNTTTVVPPDGLAGSARDAQQTLRAFIEAADGGYALCLCNSPVQRDQIVADLSRELAGLNIGFFRLKLQRSAPSIAGALRLALDAGDFRECSGPVAKVAISVEDIDETIPTEYRDLSVRPPTLQGLNQQRDWLNKLGRPLLLWFPEWLMSRLREVAPDLWAGRAVVVEFESPGNLEQFQQAYLAARWSPVESSDEAHRRIRIYQDLLKGKLDPTRRAELFVSLGNLHEKLGNWESALQEFEQASTVYQTLGDKLNEGIALGYLGLVWMDKGEWDKALEYMGRSLKLGQDIGSQQMVAMALANIGSVHRLRGEWDMALGYYEKALKLDREIGHKRGESATLGNIGSIHHLRGERDKALEYQEKALMVFEELGAKQEQANLLGNIGRVWQDRGEWDKALEYYEKALKLDRELGNKQGEAQALGNIGVLWKDRGVGDRALEYFERAHMLDRELGDKHGESLTLGNIGVVWKDRGEWDKALANFEKVLGIAREMRDLDSEAKALCNIGNTFAGMGRHDEAVPKLAQALTMFLQMGAADGPMQCLWGLNVCLKAMGRVGFIAACDKAGVKRKEAEELAEGLEKIEAKGQ